MESKGISSNQYKNIKINHRTQHPGTAKNPNVPEEIIIEILTRLPVRVLMKFRCVSRSWLSIISSPWFIKTHYQISSKDSTFTGHRVMFTVKNSHYDLRQYPASSLMSDDVISIADYPKIDHYTSVWVVGSCNGLLCISVNENNLFFWNPATRVSTNLPRADFENSEQFWPTYGFGYSEVTDEYKVLGIFCPFPDGKVHGLVVKMYSSRTDSWKVIEEGGSGGSGGDHPLQDSGVFASGKLHFPLFTGNGTRWDILAFDLDTEHFGMLEQPDHGEGPYECTLGVLGGCICVFHNYQDARTDVWVLREYGVQDSWTRVAAFPYANDPLGFQASRPLFELPTGEVLLICDEARLAIYNQNDNSLRHPETNNLGNFVQAEVYVESLVSPPGKLKTTPQKKVRQVMTKPQKVRKVKIKPQKKKQELGRRGSRWAPVIYI